MAMAQPLDDWEQVRQLYMRYANSIDEGQVDDWLACFTADACVEHPVLGRRQGHAGLREFAEQYLKSLGGTKPRHFITNVAAELEGDNGTGSCYFLYYKTWHGRTELAAVGGYRDVLRKENGRWLMVRRRVFVDTGMTAKAEVKS